MSSQMPREQAPPEPGKDCAGARSAYAEVDETIERWVARNSLTLCRDWEGEARFWYTSRGNECFQVAVDRPANGSVTVHAWGVETDDDAELHGEWSVALTSLEQALIAATDLIDLWSKRVRVSA